MLLNYFKIALKHLLASKLFSLVNIAGLGVGLACCLLIGLYLRFELGYDRHFALADRILVVESRDEKAGRVERVPMTALPLAPMLQQEFPAIEATARRQTQGAMMFSGEQSFNEFFSLVDPSFLELFDFTWLEGSPETALSDPASIVLTQASAAKYFGAEPALGKIIEVQRFGPDRHPVRVTGVIADQPRNTSLNFSALMPLENRRLFYPEGAVINDAVWNFRFSTTYLLMREGRQGSLAQDRLDAFARRTLPQTPVPTTLGVLPLTSLHFQRFDTVGSGSQVSPLRLAAFTAIAVCVLLIAMINFVNLSTVKAVKRAKEVGLRKACGASRGQLMLQYLGESALQAALALGLALLLARLLMPVLAPQLGIPPALDLLQDSWTLPAILAFTLLTGLGAGFYPALVLSAFTPASVLKGELTRSKAGASVRAALVVLQFSGASVLLVCALTVAAQMRFASSMDMGFTRDQVVVVELPRGQQVDLESRWPPLRARLLEHPGIEAVTHAASTAMLSTGFMYSTIGKQGEEARQQVYLISIEPDYFRVHEIGLVAGRLLSADRAGDRVRPSGEDDDGPPNRVLLNTRAAEMLGWSPQEALGQLLSNGSEVVGVVENTLRSTRDPVPAILYSVPSRYNYVSLPGQLSLRLGDGDPQAALRHLESAWNEFLPGATLDWRFLNEDLQRIYFQELAQLRFFNGAAFSGLLIACLGLFALAALTTQQRTKEISVRKVLGGSAQSIVLLLTRRFTVLVLLANLLAWPLAWLAMSRWLEGFTYRIELGPALFLSSALITLVIAWTTVALTVAKAANAKPALALRYE